MRAAVYILLSTILTLVLGATATSAAQTADPIKDCPPDLVCLTRDEAVALRSQELDLRAEIVNLREKLAVANAKRLKRFGGSVGCGGGVAAGNWGDGGTWTFAPYCGYLWGWRF